MINRMQWNAFATEAGRQLKKLAVFLYVGFVVVCFAGGRSCAQGLFRPLQNVPSGRFLEVPRSLQQALREAEEAVEGGRYSDAVLRLGEIASGDYSDTSVDDLQGQDFFLPIDGSIPAGRPISSSFLKRVRALLGDLPGEALDTYELQYGPTARKALDEAAGDRDWLKVSEVRRRFFHTRAGYDASVVLAQRSMLLGHPLEATLYLADLLASDRAMDYLGDEIVVMHAAACAAAGQPLPVAGVQDRFQRGSIQVEILGQSIQFATWDEVLEWANERFTSAVGNEKVGATIAEVWEKQSETFAMFGGDVSRNRANGGQLPLTNERWRLSTTASPLQERTLRQDVEDLRTSGKLPPPSWVPLRVGDQLLMRTTERLVGIDHRTGKRVWTYPWQLGLDSLEEEPSDLEGMLQGPQQPPLLSQRVWNDLPYGQITSDGEQVYLLDQLGQLESVTMNAMLNMRGVRRLQNRSNTLVALELETEGKLRWRIGADEDSPSTLSDAFFLGPPLPIDGRLFVMAEIAGDICLCCLDSRSGQELWRQQLVTVESGGVQSDPIRRVAGAMPTYHEGVLICPTGAGAVVAIDLVDRTLRWGATVERNAEMYRSINGTGRALETVKLMQRWHNGVAVAEGTAVLITPVESDRLYGLDLLTGEKLFPEKNRVQMMYLAGIRNGTFLVVGTHQIRAFSVESGDMVWASSRDLVTVGQQISGLGVFGKYDYFLPTTTNEIIQVSLTDGTVRQRRETQYPLGNLISAGGQLVSQGPTSLAVAFGQSTLEPEVERRLTEDPDDFEAIVRKSEILIQKGDLSSALDYLQRARQMRPGDDEVRMLSVSALLGRLRSGASGADNLVEVLESLIDRPRQRVQLIGLQTRAAIDAKNYQGAVESLMELSALVASDSLLDSSDLALDDDPTLQCSLDSWIAARAAEVYAAAGPSELEAIDALIESKCQLIRSGSDHLLRSTLMHFGSFRGVGPLRRELADRMLDREDAVGLERLAWGSDLPGDQALAQLTLSRLQILATAYALGRMPRDEQRVLQEMERRLKSEANEPLDSWGDSLAGIDDRLDELSTALQEITWPDEVSLTWDARTTRIIRSLSQTQRFSDMQRLAGEQMIGWRLYGEGSSPLSLMSPQGMRLRIAVDGDVSEAEKTAVVSGGVMVVVTRSELIAVNLLALFSGVGDPVLWQRPVSGEGGAPMVRRSSVTPFDDKVIRYAVDNSMTTAVIPEFSLGPILGDRLIILQGGDLVALDLVTAETLWRNAAAPANGAVVTDGKQIAVVSDSTGTVAFFDPVDGQQLETQVWSGGQLWSSLGTHVLSYQPMENVDQFKIQLFNPFSGEVVLEHEAMKANRSGGEEALDSSYGRVEGGRYLNLLSNQGDAFIWDLVLGKEVCNLKLEPFPSLAGLNVMQLGQRMVWLPRAKTIPPTDPTEPQIQTSDGRYHVAVDRIHAMNLEDGNLLWERKFDSTWGCTVMQPADSPLLILARSPFAFSTINGTRRKDMDVMAIHARDGKTAELTEGRPVLSGNNQLETKVMIQPNGRRLLVEVGVEHLLYQFGPPELATPDGALIDPTEADAPSPAP